MIVTIYGTYDNTNEIKDYSFCVFKIPYHMILSNDDRLEIKYNRHGNIEVTLDSGDIYGRTLGNCFIPFVGLEYPYHKKRYQYVFDRIGNCISHPNCRKKYAKIDMCNDKSFSLWAESIIKKDYFDSN